uniref:ATPase AAA-type core domain-containing protein n=2 Tax=Babesia bovis TaxID=5865 RepID=S6C8D7_BABBO|nr:hypothetical protein [Babesia bovis]
MPDGIADFSIDAVCLFINPCIRDPVELLRSKLIRCLLNECLQFRTLKGLKCRLQNHRFVTPEYIKSILAAVEEACQLFKLPECAVDIVTDDKEEVDSPAILPKPEHMAHIRPMENSSHFERALMDFFTPFIYHNALYKHYNLQPVEELLICGANASKKFIRWFKSLQAVVNDSSTSHMELLNLHIIRIEDILSPYFGESERRLASSFGYAMSTVGKGLTCICIEGIHHFQANKDDLTDLDRRLLATLLLLLDGVSKADTILPMSNVDAKARLKGPLMIVATSDKPSEELSESLTRPGRLSRTINYTD